MRSHPSYHLAGASPLPLDMEYLLQVTPAPHSRRSSTMKLQLPLPCHSMDYTVRRILQARILEWVAFPFSGDLPNPGSAPRSPTLQEDSLPCEPPGKPKNTGMGSLSLLQGIFPTQELNQGLLHPQPLSLRQATAHLHFHRETLNTVLAQSLWSPWVLVHTRFCLIPSSVSGRYGV